MADTDKTKDQKSDPTETLGFKKVVKQFRETPPKPREKEGGKAVPPPLSQARKMMSSAIKMRAVALPSSSICSRMIIGLFPDLRPASRPVET